MKIRFSRHARRRASLYHIQESTILEILQKQQWPPGTHEVIEHVEGFRYPIKIVAVIEGDALTVITAYPLKRGRKR